MQQSSCQYSSKNSGASATGVISIASGSETDLLAAVATVGPVAIAVDANTNAFRVGILNGCALISDPKAIDIILSH